MLKKMTEEQQQQVEQITKVPDLDAEPTSKTKEKDPKRVKAGRKLAEDNKEAREALKREMDRDEGRAMNQPEVEKSSWFPELSFDRVLPMIGIGLAAWNIFGKTRGTFRFERPPESNYVSEQKDATPVAPQKPRPPEASPPTRPLIGMD